MPSRAATKQRHAALVVLIAAALLAVPFPALAAKGTTVSYSVSVVGQLDTRTTVVGPDQLIAFDASFTNAPSGTLTHFRFDGVLPGGTLLEHPSPCAPVPGSSDAVACELGSLAAAQQVSLRFLYRAPSTIGLGGFEGRFSADAKQGNPNAAKVDVWPETAAIEVTTSDVAFGAWQPAHGPTTFTTIGVTGGQRSTVRATAAVAFDYLLQIRHTNEPVTCGGGAVAGFGSTLDLSVANGTAPVAVTLEYGPAAAAGKVPGQVAIVHEGLNGCSFPPSNCKLNPGFCYDASWSGGGANRTLVIRVELPTNGKIRGI